MPLKIDPASNAEVAVYAPYYGAARRPLLPLAVGLYKKASFEGLRPIEGDPPVPFIASWIVSPLPSDQTICQVQFNREAEQSYELQLSNYEFIDFLIDVVIQINRGQDPDFTMVFYKKLMRREDTVAQS